jgi:hypothetical protein
MATVGAELWIFGSDQQWNIKLPFCLECSGQAINEL